MQIVEVYEIPREMVIEMKEKDVDPEIVRQLPKSLRFFRKVRREWDEELQERDRES